MRAGWVAIAGLACSIGCFAQAGPKSVGSVAAADATVSGPAGAVVAVANGRYPVAGTATVTARAGHNAEVSLVRGGGVLVCQSTVLHVTPAADDSLLLAMDRGAMEIHMKAGTSDVLMTPDMRFTFATAGTLDLRLHVNFNGDTCVENRGKKAPELNITDAYGEAAYLLKPGQHVTFENGSLRVVMDHETTPCGCPPAEKEPAGLSLADAILSGGQTAPVTPQQAAAAHPFPVAVSEGLAAPPAPVPETPGERHVQVTSTLAYTADSGSDTPAATPAPIPPAPLATPPAPAKRKTGPFAAIGRFFKSIFVR